MIITECKVKLTHADFRSIPSLVQRLWKLLKTHDEMMINSHHVRLNGQYIQIGIFNNRMIDMEIDGPMMLSYLVGLIAADITHTVIHSVDKSALPGIMDCNTKNLS